MIAVLLAASLFAGLPDLPEIRRPPSITYLDRAGTRIGVRGGQIAPPVDVARLPAYVPAAFVAIEDRRFYEHSGFDAIGIARALVADVARGRAAQGASTITQQLARNLFLTSDQTLERKGQELVYAVELERRFSKRQILGLYLSRVYFGSGAYGIEAAAERFFDKPAARLSLREAAALAAVLKSPARYNPIDAPERSDERTRLVLDAMVDTGAITRTQRAKALAHPLKVQRTAPTAAAQYFVDWADAETRRLIGPLRQDLVVETTLDLPMESAAAAAARAVVARAQAQGVEETALAALDATGRVRAMIGGVDYAASPFNRATQAHRQAGSAWKPFVYLTAMETGRTPDTPVVDEPVTIGGWSPRNYSGGYLGDITLRRAIAESVNTVAARLADEVGRDNVARTAHRVGIASPINTDPAMALGTTLVTPLEMAQAYAPFSNGGDRVAAFAIERIRTPAGVALYRHRGEPAVPVIANPALSYMNDMLRGVIASGTGVRAAVPGRDLAGKTGTTSDDKDAWFCGYTGGFTTVVWVGRDDAKAMRGVTGAGPPAQLWRAFMVAALDRGAGRPIPAGPPAPAIVPALTLLPPAQDAVAALLNESQPLPETLPTPPPR